MGRNKLKGVVLAGGTGTRLRPLTDVTNKHLLPVGNKSMIVHAIDRLVEASINDILLITGPEHMGDMITLLGGGSHFQCDLTYRVQENPLGIANALLLAEDFCGDSKFVVILGDNIFENDIKQFVDTFIDGQASCCLALTHVAEPNKFGVIKFVDGIPSRIIEKPKEFVSDQCVVGLYAYDSKVFDVIRMLQPSSRNEYEITDVNNSFLDNNDVLWVDIRGWWTDAGTMSSYHHANALYNQQTGMI